MYSSARLADSRSGLSVTHALVAEHHRLLRAGELGRGEAEPRDALELGHERVEAARDAVVRDERLEHRFVLRPRRREQAAIRGRPEERRVRALAELVEPGAEHAAEQLVEHDARDSRRPIPGCAPAEGR